VPLPQSKRAVIDRTMTPLALENLTQAANVAATPANRMREWISAALVARTLGYLVSRGCDGAALADVAGVDLSGDFHDLSERRVPRAAIEALLAAGAGLLEDEAVGVRLATTVQLPDYHVMGYAVMTATTSEEALRRAARYTALFSNATTWKISLDGPVGKVSCITRYEANVGRWQATECALAEFLHCFRSSCGVTFQSPVTRFQHPAPSNPDVQRRFFGGVVLYGQPENSFTFDTAILVKPPRDANPSLADYFGRVAEKILAREKQDESVANAVRGVVGEELASGTPTIRTVARRLAMSERTLRRRLAEEGTSWANLLDEYRRDEAARLLARSQSVTDTAYLLGFSDISAFSRAYRRWYGALPSGRRVVARRS
jgi:AraC-like DNA-binding protein